MSEPYIFVTHHTINGGGLAEALALSKTSSIDVLGMPGPVAADVLRRNAEHGVRVSVKPRHLGGFTRPGGR